MADVHNKATRSFNMSRIRNKDTKPEILIRKFLFHHGFRYRLHVAKLPGKPDIVLSKYKTVIFVNGCFWHGHEGCKYFRLPKTNTEWWQSKIKRNIVNDKEKHTLLQKAGYNVIVIWECEIKNKTVYNTLIDEIKR
ncbi:MAG: very short patch repair endonuclease [Tannerellaceae bacterium]